MSSSPFPGPIAPESNPPINPQYYQPSLFYISAITLGTNTTITTTVNHNYVIGQQVRLLIPFTWGSYQLNESQGQVVSIPSVTQVIVNIDSSKNVNPFITSPIYAPTPAQISAIGDVNSGQINTAANNTITYIQGSFINISPA